MSEMKKISLLQNEMRENAEEAAAVLRKSIAICNDLCDSLACQHCPINHTTGQDNVTPVDGMLCEVYSITCYTYYNKILANARNLFHQIRLSQKSKIWYPL